MERGDRGKNIPFETVFQMGCKYKLIRYDTEKEEPVRDPRGFCIDVPKGEPILSKHIWGFFLYTFFTYMYSELDVFLTAGETGLFVVKIGEKTPFIGYAKNTQQTEKKKLRDVFVKGDLYFNSGDLLKIDHEGFVFFQDRIGDTFRSVDETNRVGWALGGAHTSAKAQQSP